MGLDLYLELIAAAAFVTKIHNFFIGTIGFIGALGLVVFIHELGHFLAAKLFGVPVERFVLGFDKDAIGIFPRCIWERKIGETVYGLSLIPLGGYVKLSGTMSPELEAYLEGEEEKKKQKKAQTAGEHPDTISKEFAAAREQDEEKKKSGESLQAQAMGDMAALYKRPYYQKVVIYGAGVFMNMVLAVFVMGFLWAWGFPGNAPYDARVGWIPPDSPYASTELKPGDYVVAINDIPVKTEEDMMKAIDKVAGGKQLGGDGGLKELPLNMKLAHGASPNAETYMFPVTLTDSEEQLTQYFDVFTRRDAYIDFVLPNSPADKGGMKAGDTVLRINDEAVADWSQFRYIVSHSPGEDLNMLVKRGKEDVALTIKPWEDANQEGKGQVGVFVGNPNKIVTKEPVVTAFKQAPYRVYIMTSNYVGQLKALGAKLTEGKVKAVGREVGGPVGIAQIAGRMAQNGFTEWLRFLIMLNVALAVMNILPFPVLDGGHIVFATYEAVFRRPVPAKVLVPLLNGAVVLILIFVVVVTFNDVAKMFFK